MELNLPVLWAFVGGAGVFATFATRTLLRKWHASRRLGRARRGEHKAISLLQQNGYRVLELQAHRTFAYLVDGAHQKASVRCDVLAKKRGKTYVVEVKPGIRRTRRLFQPAGSFWSMRGCLKRTGCCWPIWIEPTPYAFLRRSRAAGGSPHVACPRAWPCAGPRPGVPRLPRTCGTPPRPTGPIDTVELFWKPN